MSRGTGRCRRRGSGLRLSVQALQGVGRVQLARAEGHARQDAVSRLQQQGVDPRESGDPLLGDLLQVLSGRLRVGAGQDRLDRWIANRPVAAQRVSRGIAHAFAQRALTTFVSGVMSHSTSTLFLPTRGGRERRGACSVKRGLAAETRACLCNPG